MVDFVKYNKVKPLTVTGHIIDIYHLQLTELPLVSCHNELHGCVLSENQVRSNLRLLLIQRYIFVQTKNIMN